MSKRRKTGPLIPQLHDHAAFVTIMSKLNRNQVEHFFFRSVRDRTTAIILRELAYWLDQSGKNPGYPRAKVFRHEFYWVARTKQELLDAHGIGRKEVERACVQTKDFVVTKNMRFGMNRVTHWRFDFPRLMDLFHADPIIRKQLGLDGTEEAVARATSEPLLLAPTPASECTATPLNTDIVGCHGSTREADMSQCTDVTDDTSQSYNQSSLQQEQADLATGSAGTGRSSPSAPSGANAPEPPPQSPAYMRGGKLLAAQVLQLLDSVRGVPWPEKSTRIPTGNRRVAHAIGYLMAWQLNFEEEHPKRRYPFTAQDVERAWALAEEEISLKLFSRVLVESHDSEGPKEGKNPVFMAENHSHEFKAFCKHFTRIEIELTRVGRLEDE